jgi:hypothetical protein
LRALRRQEGQQRWQPKTETSIGRLDVTFACINPLMLGIGLNDSRFGFVLSAAQPIDWVNAALMLDRQLRFPQVFE